MTVVNLYNMRHIFLSVFLSFSPATCLDPIEVLRFIIVLYFDLLLQIFDNYLTFKLKVYFCFAKERGKPQSYLGKIYDFNDVGEYNIFNKEAKDSY